MSGGARIYYADGAVYDGPVEDAPTVGVAVIAEPRSDGRVLHQRCGYYVYCKDGWYPCTSFDGMLDLVLHRFDSIVRVFQGRAMTNDDFWALYERAKRENP